MDKKKIVSAVIGLVVFVAAMWLLQKTNLMAYAFDGDVEAGKLSAPSAMGWTWVLEVGSSVFATAVFLFSRLGDAAIAFVTSLLTGQKPVASVVSSTAVGAVTDQQMVAMLLHDMCLDGNVEGVRALAHHIHGKEFLNGKPSLKRAKIVEEVVE